MIGILSQLSVYLSIPLDCHSSSQSVILLCLPTAVGDMFLMDASKIYIIIIPPISILASSFNQCPGCLILVFFPSLGECFQFPSEEKNMCCAI